MSSTISPNMNLVIPTVGSENGPTYAFDINTSLTLIDQHDHTSGNGVQITPAAININSALSFATNFATDVAGISLYAQGSTPSTSATIYESGVDLYYKDGNGVPIRITASGGIAGSPGSISNLTSPASAAYVSGSSSFVWQSNTSIAADMDFGAAIMRNLSPNSTYALTLQPPAALSSNFSITLPTLPIATGFLTMTSSGVISGATALIGVLTTSNLSSSAGILGTQLSASAGITGTQLSASANIAGSQLSASANIAATQLAFNPYLNKQQFIIDGTWTAPAGVTSVLVIGCGGGGAGGCANAGGGQEGFGGDGAPLGSIPCTVIPGTPYAVTIGAGGTAQAGGTQSTRGNNGSTSSLAALAIFKGGRGGAYDTNPWPGPGRAGSAIGGLAGLPGQDSVSFDGGTGSGGGGGGAGPYGNGGNGASGSVATSPSANSGAGGGGGTATAVDGAAGGSGTIFVMW